MKKNLHIGIGITAGIAGYKIVELIRFFKIRDIRISIIMTSEAVKMFGTEMFANASGNKIYENIIPDSFDYREVLKNKKVEHIALADSLDLLLIAPATANILAKISSGIADDFLTTLVLSVTCSVVIAPSMNSNMWKNRVTQDNLNKLRNLGFLMIAPDSGSLACGYEGVGRLKDTAEIESFVLNLLGKKESLKGLKILVSAGGTSVPLDPVRVITNRSSGKMGKYLAEAAYRKGAEVMLLRAANSVKSELPVSESIFSDVTGLKTLLTRYCSSYDIIFHSAAVSDFSIKENINGKLDSTKEVPLTLIPGEKLINNIRKLNPRIFLVAFKAEIGIKKVDLNKVSAKIFKDSAADILLVNDVGRKDIGFSSDFNEIWLIEKNGSVSKFQKERKSTLAEKIIDKIIPLYNNK